MITGTFAYIADTVPPEKRSMRMTILDAILTSMAALGNLIVGWMIDQLGYFYPYVFCLVGKIIALVYAVFFIPETVRKSPETNTRKCSDFFERLSAGVKLFIVDDGKGRRGQLIMLMGSYIIAGIISTMSILTLYEMNAPLCWDSLLIGYFGAISDISMCFAMVLVAILLTRWISDKWLVVLGMVSNISYYAYLALVSSTVMMFICK